MTLKVHFEIHIALSDLSVIDSNYGILGLATKIKIHLWKANCSFSWLLEQYSVWNPLLRRLGVKHFALSAALREGRQQVRIGWIGPGEGKIKNTVAFSKTSDQ